MFLPDRRVVLLDGEIKKRDDIPPKILKRMRGYRDAVLLQEASGASQPYVAKLESGRIKNLGIKTLVKYATALGGKLTLKIDTAKSGSKPSHRVLRKAG